MEQNVFSLNRGIDSRYAKLRIIPSSPEQIPKLIQKRVESNLKLLYQGKVKKFTTAFLMPEELHFLPLFQEKLFSELVKFHNKYSTPDRYVDPEALMALDKNITSFIPLDLGADLPLEDLSHHEMKHFIELQGNKPNATGLPLLFMTLGWRNTADNRKVLTLGGVMNMRLSKTKSAVNAAMAPNYPSGDDFGVLTKIHDSLPTGMRYLFSIPAVMAYINKAREQGLGFLRFPVEQTRAYESVYPKWKEANKSRIEMKYFP